MKFSSILGIVIFFYTLYVAYTGKIYSRNAYENLDRSTNPVMFWIAIVVTLVASLVLIFNIYSF